MAIETSYPYPPELQAAFMRTDLPEITGGTMPNGEAFSVRKAEVETEFGKQVFALITAIGLEDPPPDDPKLLTDPSGEILQVAVPWEIFEASAIALQALRDEAANTEQSDLGESIQEPN